MVDIAVLNICLIVKFSVSYTKIMPGQPFLSNINLSTVRYIAFKPSSVENLDESESIKRPQITE